MKIPDELIQKYLDVTPEQIEYSFSENVTRVYLPLEKRILAGRGTISLTDNYVVITLQRWYASIDLSEHKKPGFSASVIRLGGAAVKDIHQDNEEDMVLDLMLSMVLALDALGGVITLPVKRQY